MHRKNPPNGNAPPSTLGVDTLRHALEAYLRGELDHPPDDRLRISARVMCEDARGRGLRVEELLISLKRNWTTVVGVERLRRDESSRLLARVVTLCVEEYYAPLG